MSPYQKVAKKFSCKICDYFTDKISNLKKHFETEKHKNRALVNVCPCLCDEKVAAQKMDYLCDDISFNEKNVIDQEMAASSKKVADCIKSSREKTTLIDCINDIEPNYQCKKCKRQYKKYNSYWKHEKRCSVDVSKIHNQGYMSMINKLINENRELRNFVIDQSNEYKKETKSMMNKMLELSSTKNTIVTNTINGDITNNRLNINVFLNEKCKDAMNLTDFIETVQITDVDLENNAQLGFVNGISKIILDNLKQLSIFERPIHCTDIKRETIYIKDEDKWEKEEDMKKIKNAIQEISRKSIVHLSQWREENPNYVDLDSELGEKYISMNKASIAGTNREIYHNKIIKKVAKETMIDKSLL